MHIAPDGTKVDYTAEDNALIAEADRTGGGAIRIADVHLPAAADVVENVIHLWLLPPCDIQYANTPKTRNQRFHSHSVMATITQKRMV